MRRTVCTVLGKAGSYQPVWGASCMVARTCGPTAAHTAAHTATIGADAMHTTRRGAPCGRSSLVRVSGWSRSAPVPTTLPLPDTRASLAAGPLGTGFADGAVVASSGGTVGHPNPPRAADSSRLTPLVSFLYLQHVHTHTWTVEAVVPQTVGLDTPAVPGLHSQSTQMHTVGER